MPNPLESYEAALAALSAADERDSLDHKHKAVLALTRAGSLDFALSEYARYGLDKIRHHEDIMALGGRLFKDLYLSTQGNEAKEHARSSAEKYEEAFKDTGGYYSGINAATMSLLGGIPPEIVKMRAERILEILPELDAVTGDEIYFTEATRAEAYVLLERPADARAALRRAIDYDPLNFTAHASTLKQFRMIANARGEELSWLAQFNPPRGVHFAGHIFGTEGEGKNVPVLSKDQQSKLSGTISDIIQEYDIGFGYGAPAAGADIVIAEALIAEGCELHIVLPVSKKIFVEKSVAPFGKSWIGRFKTCLKNAKTVTVFDNFERWPDSMLQFRASLTAMGGAARQSDFLSARPAQLLIWDQKEGNQGTACDADIWTNTGRLQIVVPYPGPRNAKPHPNPDSQFKYVSILGASDDRPAQHFDDIREAISSALKNREETPTIRQGIAMALVDTKSDDPVPEPNLCSALPGAIHICEPGANYVAVYLHDQFAVSFMGLNEQGYRVYSLREKG